VLRHGAVLLGLRRFYGHGVYLAELQRLHRWPASLISGATTVYYLFSAALVIFVSDAIERLGPRRFVLIGIAMLGLSVALLAMIEAPWQLYGAYLVMAFGWAAMSLASITNILGLWFRERRGLAISLALNGASCGGILVVPALVAAIGRIGFPAAVLAAAAIMVVILVPLVAIWIRRPPEARTTIAQPRAASPLAGTRWTRSQALRSFRFWTVSAPFALALAAQVGFLVHQLAFLEPRIGREPASVAVAVTSAMAVLGRVGLGTIIDRLDQRLVSALSCVSQAFALFVMTRTVDGVVLFAACALFGLSVGNLITLPALIIQREFDAASFGLLISLSTAIGQVTYAFGPGILGLLRDATGGYASPLAFCMGVEILAAVIVLLRGGGVPRPS
jgi:predicted MFS family arabinose efflux permease